MNAIKVDPSRRVRLRIFTPGDLYEPEFRGADQITLRRISSALHPRSLTKTQALKSIEKSALRFARSWDQIREETRE